MPVLELLGPQAAGTAAGSHQHRRIAPDANLERPNDSLCAKVIGKSATIARCPAPRDERRSFGSANCSLAPRSKSRTQYSVQMIDRATDELVGEFDSYGNLNCQDPGSDSPHPELPFGTIAALSVWQDRLFVVDVLNRRIVKCRIVYDGT